MTYCLMTEDGKIRVEIRCSLADKPTTVGELYAGVTTDRIQMIKPTKLPIKVESGDYVDVELDTDWERTGVGSRLINWIPIENL